MPELVWSARERARLDDVLAQLDPSRRAPVQAYRHRLSDEDYSFLIDYINRELRGSLLIGAAIDALVESAVDEGAADRARALELSRRAVLRSRNFGIIDDSDQRFTRISLSEEGSGLAVLVEALRAEAEALFFGQTYTVRPLDIDLTALEEPNQG